jgi:hypothetical protein
MLVNVTWAALFWEEREKVTPTFHRENLTQSVATQTLNIKRKLQERTLRKNQGVSGIHLPRTEARLMQSS